MRHKAVKNLYDNVVNQVGNRAYDINGDLVDVDETKVAEEIKKLETDYDAKKYQRDRADTYPSIQEQLDMQYWDAVNGTKKWQEAVAKVKKDNPKSE